MTDHVITVTHDVVNTITVEHVVATGGGGIGEAPNDGQQYARQSQAWSVVVGGGGGVDYTLVTTQNGATLANGNIWTPSSTTGTASASLPVSPSDGDLIRIKDVDGNAETNTITVQRNGNTIAGDATDLTITINNKMVELLYDLANTNWVLISD